MAQVKDPVCGIMVDSATAEWKSNYQGETYYFCAESCKQSFDADPAQYIGREGSGGAEQHEPPFTQADGMTSPKFGSAGSGGAEYELLPEAHDKMGTPPKR